MTFRQWLSTFDSNRDWPPKPWSDCTLKFSWQNFCTQHQIGHGKTSASFKLLTAKTSSKRRCYETSSNCVAEFLAGAPPLDPHSETLTTRFFKRVIQSNENLKKCVVESHDNNANQEIAILEDFDKFTNCGGPNSNRRDVIPFAEHKKTRGLSSLDHTSSTPVSS